MSSDTANLDPDTAEALANALRRRGKLERLSDIGMELAERIGDHAAAAMSAINEKYEGDPTRAFATVSRQVRLTLAMEARVDAQILALRKGQLPLGWGMGVQTQIRMRPSGRHAPCENLRPSRESLVEREAFEEVEFTALTPHPSEEAGEVAGRAKRGGTEGAQGQVTGRRCIRFAPPPPPDQVRGRPLLRPPPS